MRTAIKIRAPMTVPAIRAIDVWLPESGVEDEEGEEGEGDEGFGGGVWEGGEEAVDEGDWLLRQVASSVMPTVLISAVPPLRPVESNMENTREVPAATLAFQLKVVEPMGGVRTNEVPPGTVPTMVTGWMAPSYPLTMYGLHCWRAEFNSKLKATPGSVRLQAEDPREGPVVRMGVDPPVPKPVPSDMVRTNRWDAAMGRGKEKEPCPPT
jgi:hypothetical protein